MHNYVMYSELLFSQVKYGDEARREASISDLQAIVEQFNNLLGPDFQTILEPVTQAIVEIADARLGKGDPQDRQLLNDDAMDKLHALSSTLGFYFGSMAPQNPRLCHDEQLLCCIRDGWGAVVNQIIEMVYALQEDGRDANAYNRAVDNVHNAAALFGHFLDTLCLKPKPPCPKGITVFDDTRRTLNIAEQDPRNPSGVARGDAIRPALPSTPEEIDEVNNGAPANIGELMEDYGDLINETIGSSLHDIIRESGCVQKAVMETKPAISPFNKITEGVQRYPEGQSPYESSYEFVSFKIYDGRDPDNLVLLREVLSDDEAKRSSFKPATTNVDVGRVTLLLSEEEEAISGTLFSLTTPSRIDDKGAENQYTLIVRDSDDKDAIDLSDILVEVSLVWSYKLKNGEKETAQVTLFVKGAEQKTAERAKNHYQTKQPLITRDGNVYAIVTKINFVQITSSWKQVSIEGIHVFAADSRQRAQFLEFYRKHVTLGERVPVKFGRVKSAPSDIGGSRSVIAQQMVDLVGAPISRDVVKFSGISPTTVAQFKSRYLKPVGRVTQTIAKRETKIRSALLGGTIRVVGGERPLFEARKLPVHIGRYEGGRGASGDKLLFVNQLDAPNSDVPYLEFRIKGRARLEISLELELQVEDEKGTARGAQRRGADRRPVRFSQKNYALEGALDLTSTEVDNFNGNFQSASQRAEDGRAYVVRLTISQNAAEETLHGELDTNLYGIGAIAFLISDPRR